MPIQFPNENLLEARNVVAARHENHLLCQQPPKANHSPFSNTVHLIPEFTHILPVPLDFLFAIGGLAERFMPRLEREIDLCMQAHGLRSEAACMAATTTDIIGNSRRGGASPMRLQWPHRQERTLPDLLREATTLVPKQTYQRLEFLGDAVLGFFVALNAMANNALLVWDSDDLQELMSQAVRNQELARAARACTGFSSLLYSRHNHASFQSAHYGPRKKVKKASDEPDVADRQMSDCAESILAAAYLAGFGGGEESERSMSGGGDGQMVVYLLERLQLSFPTCCDLVSPLRWFRSRGACLQSGYPFHLDSEWEKRLEDIANVLNSRRDIVNVLEAGTQTLLELDVFASLSDRLFVEPWSKCLLHCALFDDDLELTDEADMLEPVALLRDTLYVVGAYGVQLMLSEEVYRRYQDAPPGDLHLARACVSFSPRCGRFWVPFSLAHSCSYYRCSLTM